MEELIKESQALLENYKTEYDRLGELFKAETDVQKMDELDKRIPEIGKDIVNLEVKILNLQQQAKRTKFNPEGLRQFASAIAAHAVETQTAIKTYTDSTKNAQYLASRISSGVSLIADIAKRIA